MSQEPQANALFAALTEETDRATIVYEELMATRMLIIDMTAQMTRKEFMALQSILDTTTLKLAEKVVRGDYLTQDMTNLEGGG